MTLTGSLSITGDLVVNGKLNVTGPKTGFLADHFINRAGGPLERGDLVVLDEKGASHYFGLDSRIPLVEVSLSDTPHDTRVCGIVHEPVLSDAELSDFDRS